MNGDGKEEKTMQEENLVKKITDAAVKYDRNRDQVVLRAFQGSAMEPEVFRAQLKKAFGMQIAKSEMEYLVAMFDNDGDQMIDGAEFLKSFFQIAFTERARRARWRREKDKHRYQHEQQERRRKEKEAFEQAHVVVVKEYTEEEKEKAFQKLREAALKYDKNSSRCFSLQAFSGAFLTPSDFKEQLKQVLGLNLTPPELKAILDHFDANGDGHIDCSEFLISFYRLAFGERSRVRREIRQKNKDHEEKHRIAKKAWEDKVAKIDQAKISKSYSEGEKDFAFHKLTEAATRYKKDAPGAMSLRGFEIDSLNPLDFREQLKRTFNLHLSPRELGALVDYYDPDGKGIIVCSEFLKDFFKRGFQERSRILRERRTRDYERLTEIEEEQRRKAEDADRRAAEMVNVDYTEEDFNRAIEKIRIAAINYDKNSPSAMSLQAFDGASMTPIVFKEQLKRVFNIKVTPAELGALVHYFDKDGDGTINCAEFLIRFFRTGFEERSRIIQSRRAWDRTKREKEEQIAKARETELAHHNALKVDRHVSDSEVESALRKIRNVSVKYDKSSPSAMSLSAFDGAALEPHEFKDQLMRVFNLKLTPKELGALVTIFDKDGDGTINCAEFMIEFFRIGFMERERLRRERRDKEALAMQKSLENLNEKRERIASRGLAKVASFDDVDLKELMDIIVDLAAKYDRRNIGFGGLKAFEVSSMTPTELREQMKQIFNVRLNARHLGAFLSLFDTRGDDTVDCSFFLKTFFKLSVRAKGIVTTSPFVTASKKLEDLRDDIVNYLVLNAGSQYEEHRKRFPRNITTAALTSGVSTPLGVGTTPNDDSKMKIKHRIRRGRISGILDLSAARNANQTVKLSTIPKTVFHFFWIHEIWLTNNKLRALPSNITKFRSLKLLCISGNEIYNLPEGIGDLTELERLIADKNHLQNLPTSITRLERLNELRLDHNSFQQFPDEVLRLPNLTVLSITNNEISHVPDGDVLSRMKNLLELEMDNNRLTEKAMRDVAGLHNLLKVGLSGNAKLAPEVEETFSIKYQVPLVRLRNSYINFNGISIDHCQRDAVREFHRQAGIPASSSIMTDVRRYLRSRKGHRGRLVLTR